MKTYLPFALTQIFSLIGSRTTFVAVGIVIFQETGSAAPILIGLFFAELPEVLGRGFGGFFTDRWDVRRILIGGDAGQAAATLLLLLSLSSGAFQIWHYYLAIFITGMFAAAQPPATAALITALVPETLRDHANGLSEVGFNLAGVIAPPLAGVLFALGGLGAVIAIDFATFLISIAVIAQLKIPRLVSENEPAYEPLRDQLTAGWRWLHRQADLMALVIYLGWIFFLMNGPLGLALPYLLSRHDDEALVGVLLGAMSAGALVGALGLTLWGDVRQRVAVMLGGYALHGAFMIAFGLVYQPLLLGLSAFFMMIPLPLNGALFSTLLQSKTPPHLTGRVFALTGQLFTLTTPLSFLLTAWLAERILPRYTEGQSTAMGSILVATGALMVVSTFIITLRPSMRSLN